jgi:predicted MFS family arabinose efflux permease
VCFIRINLKYCAEPTGSDGFSHQYRLTIYFLCDWDSWLMVFYGTEPTLTLALPLSGTGFSLTHVPMATVPMFFFDQRRAGPALGIAMSGGACGAFLLPVLIGKLVNIYGWRGSLIILGGLNLNSCVCGALLRRPKRLPKTSERTPIFDVKILRNVSFVLFLLAQVVFSMSISAVYIHITAQVEMLTKVSREKSRVVISVIGIANFLGRLTQGALSGIKSVDIFTQYNVSYLIVGAVLFITPHVQFYAFSLTFAAIFGFCIAPYVTLSQPIMVRLVGLENLTIAFGIFICMSGVGLMTGAPIAGMLYDWTGDYGTSMYFGGATMLGCVVFMTKLWVDASCRKTDLRQTEIEIEAAVDRTSLNSADGKT